MCVSGTCVSGELQWCPAFVVGAADGGSGLQQKPDRTDGIILRSVVKRGLLVQKGASLRIS